MPHLTKPPRRPTNGNDHYHDLLNEIRSNTHVRQAHYARMLKDLAEERRQDELWAAALGQGRN